MAHSVLVVSATPGFSELIQISLQDDGNYQPVCLSQAGEALDAAQETHFDFCIFDCEVNDVPLPEVIQTLHQNNADLRLVIIPPNNDSEHPLLKGLQIDSFLTKPFYIPDLVRTLNTLGDKVSVPHKQESVVQPAPEIANVPDAFVELNSSLASDEAVAQPEQTVEDAVPDWLQDVDRAAQHLTRLSLESAAHAALIVHGEKLWAYAGELPQPAAQELAEQLGRYWGKPRDGQGDLARFIHLKATDKDYMLYATALGGGVALALAFNAATPFTKMRAQAADLARALASHPVESSSAPLPSQAKLPPADIKVPPLSDDDEEVPELDLGDIPPPLPRHRTTQRLKKDQPAIPQDSIEIDALPDFSVQRLPVFDVDSLPEAVDADGSESSFGEPPAMNEWLPANAADTDFITSSRSTQSQTASDETLPHRRETRPLRLSSPTPAVCSLSFACVLVPRLPQHHLVGGIAEQLPDVMRQACLAFGWQLGHIAVRPEYLLWMVSVPPATSPSHLMRVLRYQLSERIFNEFPSLTDDNPSGDFWAPGYLIMSSHQPPPPQIVNEFVSNTRRYQGV